MGSPLGRRLLGSRRDSNPCSSASSARRISVVPVRFRLDLDPLRILLPLIRAEMVLLALGMGLPTWILDG